MGMDTHAQLKGRTAVVTGGSKGIGLAIAAAFAGAGANVAITGRDEQALAAAEQTIRSGGGSVFASSRTSVDHQVPLPVGLRAQRGRVRVH